MGTRAGWRQAPGAGMVVRGWEAWPSSEFPSAGNKRWTRVHCFGWGWKGVRYEAEGSLGLCQGRAGAGYHVEGI